jgi:hypothetical protein
MKKIPSEITLCNLEVIVMPDGEILCLGKYLGRFGKFKKCLSEKFNKSEIKND